MLHLLWVDGESVGIYRVMNHGIGKENAWGLGGIAVVVLDRDGVVPIGVKGRGWGLYSYTDLNDGA